MSAGICTEGGDHGDRSHPLRRSRCAQEDGGGRDQRAWPETEWVPRDPDVWDDDCRAACVVRLVDGSRCHACGDGESGEYWKPVFNLLESDFHVLLVNAAHIKAVPGRKTDVNEAQWIADLLKHGLLKASFVPPLGQRELRELTRHRSNFVRERARLVNRVQKVLERANIKLASVATDVLGLSGRAMLEALIIGHASPAEMAELAKGRLREKRESLTQALEGSLAPRV
jgi:hypothetical protein